MKKYVVYQLELNSLSLEGQDSMVVSHLCFLFPVWFLYIQLPGLFSSINCFSWILHWGSIHLKYIIWKNSFFLYKPGISHAANDDRNKCCSRWGYPGFHTACCIVMQRGRDRLQGGFNTRLAVKNLGSCLHSAANGPDLKQGINAVCTSSLCVK